MKKIFVLTILLLCVFSTVVNANTIYSINMDIFIDDTGNAQITENWDCKTNKGTESYHPYYNLGASEIKNLKVSDESNMYETLENWNVNSSFNSKRYKCGLNIISNGVEICWGISDYGRKIYKVEYEITNFVSQLNDSQMAYWTLIPYNFSNEIGNVNITIKSNFDYENTLDVWGYGNYGGLCYVDDGVIKMSSYGKLDTSEYVTILVKFPKDTYNLDNYIDENFDYYLSMAEDGANHYEDNINNGISESNSIETGPFFLVFYYGFMFLVMFVIIFVCGVLSGTSANLEISKEDKRKLKDAEYFRDIPCNNDIFRAFYVADTYNLNANETDFLGAILLKWLKEKKIAIEKRERGIFKKEETCIVLNRNLSTGSPEFTNAFETELYQMMLSASGDGILEKKEFEKWCSKRYNKILKWFDNVVKTERGKLVSAGYIETIEKNKFLKVKSYKLNNDLLNEAINIAGLKKFLMDYSLIHEREAIEVAMFEDYLIYAQMLGIAKRVMKEFKELYPDIIENSNFSSFDDISFVMLCASSGMNSANSARAAAQSYSSGGGGFSSGGGGGGSFGGGGGRRRFSLIPKLFFYN